MNASLGIAALTTEIPLYDGYDQELEDVRRLRNEMRRLNDLGYSLVPLGGGEDGKSPLVKFAGRGPLPLPIVLRRMEKAGSLVYGIRLGGLVALDVDAGGEEAEAAILQRFGVSAFQTQTRRGSHHFYRLEEGSSAPASFNDRGIVVDVKSGSESYVVGPWSIRGDGTVYCVVGRELPKPEELPILKDLEALRVVGRGPIRHRGHRHKALLRLAVRLGAGAASVLASAFVQSAAAARENRKPPIVKVRNRDREAAIRALVTENASLRSQLDAASAIIRMLSVD